MCVSMSVSAARAGKVSERFSGPETGNIVSLMIRYF